MDNHPIASALFAAFILASFAWLAAAMPLRPWLQDVGQALGAIEILG